MNPSLENNGAAIEYQTLYMDGGALDSAFTAIIGYDGSAETYVVGVAGEGIVAGERYRFVVTATNVHGESLPS